MGMTRNLFKKIRDTEGSFRARMGTIKDRNGMDLAEAEDIKMRWLEYIEELYKKDLHVPNNHDVVIPHIEPDILECEVKWALDSITTNKASGGDGIPVELFQILKDDAVKVLTQYASNLENSSGHRTGKVSFHSNPKERQCQRMFKLPYNCNHLTHLQSNVQNSPSQALAEEPEIKLPKSVGSSKMQEFQKSIYFCFTDYTKAFDCVDHNKLKSRDITLPTKVHLVKAMVFPVVIYGCESWTIRKAEHQRIDAFELVLEKTLESPLDFKEIQPVNLKGHQS